MAYSANLPALHRHAAGYVHKIRTIRHRQLLTGDQLREVQRWSQHHRTPLTRLWAEMQAGRPIDVSFKQTRMWRKRIGRKVKRNPA